MKFFYLITVGVIIIHSSIECKAQSEFKSGYLITNQGDSTTGLIRVSKFTYLNQIIDFKRNENDDPQTLNPDEIQEICISGLRRFISDYIPNEDKSRQKLFFEEIIRGEVSLYFFPDQDNKHHIYIKKDSQLAALSNSSVFIYSRLKKFELDNPFRSSLTYYLKECDEIQSKIKTTKYSIASMANLIQRYHECLNLEYHVENEKELKKDVSMGFSSMVNMSNLHFNAYYCLDEEMYDFTYNYESEAFPSIGLFLKLASKKVTPHLAMIFEPTYFPIKYKQSTDTISETQLYHNLQFPIILSIGILNKDKNTISLEFGASLTTVLNNPEYFSLSNMTMYGMIDFIAGLKYEVSMKNQKKLGLFGRYFSGTSSINPPFKFSGSRNRIGFGVSYELFKN